VDEADGSASIVYRRSDIVGHAESGAPSSEQSTCVIRSVGLSRAKLRSGKLPPPPRPQQPRTLRPELRHGAVCTLGVVVDHTYLEQVARGHWQLAVSRVVQHVAEADSVFRATDMDLDAVPENIGFRIGERITVYRSATSADYPMSDTSVDGVETMNRFASENFDRFCLAVAFTFREFGQLLSSLPQFSQLGQLSNSS